MENDEFIKRENKKGKKYKIVIVLLIIAIISLIIGGTYLFISKNNTSKEKVSKETKKVYSEYKLSGNGLEDFDLHFLQLENAENNKIYSPLSIKYALEMLKEGSVGESKEEINSVIGEYSPKTYTNSENMSFANAMFIRNSFKDSIKASYTDKISNKYNAEIVYDDFTSAENINNWVSNKTFNLVNNLLDDVSNDDFILVNALAIDMEWKKKIQATSESYEDMYSVSYPHEKYSASIVPIDGDRYETVNFNDKKVKAVEIGASINNYDIVNTLGEENIRKTVGEGYKEYMAEDPCGLGESMESLDTFLDRYIKEINSNYKKVEASTDFKFYNDDNIKAFSKELKEYNGTTLEYIGIMPKVVSLKEYIENTSAKDVNTLINDMKTVELDNFETGKITEITGYIPLFNFEYELKLKEDLNKLGIKSVFNKEKADLSKLTSNKNAFIDNATHKANIEFSNEGIKAAAATALGGLGAASCGYDYIYEVPVETIDMTFDKPYLFMIRDKQTGEVWFTGTVYEPTISE